ncbi:hepcidin-1 [Corythoichthys intestinalis]|uniref:hepcidin-1 n=1 Tax=Corythoichthys intestinalis TaxID=161448 RepID=UPI0025A54236|nr:hepcidin-1 [Corythoichthys intestinalis]XP_061788975.1 hepcidin-like [Nerophis lumbriciformis]
MKAFSIAVAVTLVLAFICIVESSALPFNEGQQMEEAIGGDTPVAGWQDDGAELWTPYHVRQKRQSNLSLCRWCCNCCRSYKGCGFCCKY